MFFVIFLQVADALETKLGRNFQLVMDKGTLDAMGLHADGPVKRSLMSNLVQIYPWLPCYITTT